MKATIGEDDYSAMEHVSVAPEIDIHTVRPDELDAVSRVIRAAYQEYRKELPPGVFRSYMRDIADVRSRLGEAELVVASAGGRPVGAVTLYLDASRSQREGWPAGWAGIRILAVHPRFRGRGIGRALMEECLRRCRESGIKTVGLHTTEAMAVARRMYERMGFRRAPEYDFYPRPGVVVMAYRLDL